MNAPRHTVMRWLLLVALCAAAPLQAEEARKGGSAIDRRIALEWQTRDNPFVITPHRPTYILPLSYNWRPNNAPYEASQLQVEENEIKFQLSFKVPLARKVLFGGGDLSFGYTQQSFWQAYNGNYSSPFRETNHEPEVMLTYPLDYELLGLHGRLVTLSLDHQSNGRSEPLSRSWNRVMLDFVFERDDFYMSVKPWWRVPEREAEDDNPDIEYYMGHFELRMLKKYRDHSLGLMWRNNLRQDNRGAVQFDYTFPIKKRLKGYLQIFNGYGESLIDYDHDGASVGVGVMLTDWL